MKIKKLNFISVLLVLVSLAAFVGHVKIGHYGFYSG